MWIFPTLMIAVMLVVAYLLLMRGGLTLPSQLSDRFRRTPEETEAPLDILKRRYAKGEVTKEEYEQMKKDLLN
jgi:putative membrane protein